jgi:putative Holliday junction resolvase
MAGAFVVGLPVTEDGSLSAEAKLIKDFGQELEHKLNQRVFFVNETLTSVMAEDILEGQGVSPSEAKNRVDQLSASLILQQYLEEHALA